MKCQCLYLANGTQLLVELDENNIPIFSAIIIMNGQQLSFAPLFIFNTQNQGVIFDEGIVASCVVDDQKIIGFFEKFKLDYKARQSGIILPDIKQ